MLQLDHVLHCPVVTLDLALGLGMVRSTTRVSHLALVEVVSELAREVRWAVVTEKAGPMPDLDSIHSRDRELASISSLTSFTVYPSNRSTRRNPNHTIRTR